eukprot:m51a1_g3282 putative alcohol dehydrogenase (323) ;mRNA; r:257606-258683
MSTGFRLASGDYIPALGLGTWKSSPGVVGAAVKFALETAGYRSIDCAAVYKNEAEVGEALLRVFNAPGSIVRREDVFVTSKLWNDSHSARDVRAACLRSLEALGLEYLDLYLMHWPYALKKGHQTPIEPYDMLSVPVAETWHAMEALVDEGLVRNIGVANFSVRNLSALLLEASVPVAVNQVELHPYLPQRELVDFCYTHGVHVTGYSSLGSGDRPHKRPGDVELLDDPTVSGIARMRGVTPAQVLLRWGIQRGTSVLAKSVQCERIRENVAALAGPALSEQDMKTLNSLAESRGGTLRYVEHSGCISPDNIPPGHLEFLWG